MSVFKGFYTILVIQAGKGNWVTKKSYNQHLSEIALRCYKWMNNQDI